MSKSIKVGDLVYVARDCCGRYIGWTFVVSHIYTGRVGVCGKCGSESNNESMAENPGWTKDGDLFVAPISWLRKIDPPALPEDVEHEQEITA